MKRRVPPEVQRVARVVANEAISTLGRMVGSALRTAAEDARKHVGALEGRLEVFMQNIDAALGESPNDDPAERDEAMRAEVNDPSPASASGPKRRRRKS